MRCTLCFNDRNHTGIFRYLSTKLIFILESSSMSSYAFNAEYARDADEKDPLRSYRDQFYFPQHNGQAVVYFTGNSLGLQPRSTRDYVEQELKDWETYGVEGHFHAKRPWFAYHEFLTEKAARVVGALPQEVVMMNQLTVNLHLLMVAFYRPTQKRFKIIFENGPFPSDRYALESQVKFHGFDPNDALIELQPRDGEHLLRDEDILKAIADAGDTLALVMMGGVNYYTGQYFDLVSITQAAHSAGAVCGFDLAHAAGNVELKLHDWNVDFACWCSYKYLNSGPGGVAGAFVHEKHANNDYPRFAGWWGHDKAIRFKMGKEFIPIPGAEGYQLSNAPVLSMAAHLAALEITDAVGLKKLNDKSVLLTGYLEFIIDEINKDLPADKKLEIITPRKTSQRGCQLSVIAHGQGRSLFDKLTAAGVIADWREPNVIRMAPVPLYNSFTDVYRFGCILKENLELK